MNGHNIINGGTILCGNATVTNDLTVQGNIFTVDQSNLTVTDKTITLNKNGSLTDSVGINIEKNTNITAGYIKTNTVD